MEDKLPVENIAENNIVYKSSFQKFYSNPENKKQHHARMIEKVTCSCGTKYIRSNATTHRKTKKHIVLMELQDKIQGQNELIQSLNAKKGRKEIVKP